MTIGFAATVLVFGLALWLGLYLIGRDPRAPRLLLTGSGLLAYALALACDLLSGAAPEGVGFVLERGRLLLLLLPVVLWTGAMIQLLPEETPARDRLARVWGVAAPLFAVMLVLASFGSGVAMGAANDVESVIGAVVLAPMLAVGGFAAWTLRRRRLRQVVGVLAVFTLFFALSTGLILFPPGWLPRSWVVLALGVDLISLGLAIAYFDAFDLGEALLPDTIRSFDAAALATLLFGGQVALVMALTTGPTFPMMSLLLGTTATAIAVTTLSDPVGAALDKLALGRLPLARQARSELRRTSRALPRANLELDPAALDEQEFARLTRRALSNFGDLPRLSASPLANLPLVASRIAARGARDDAIERAAELKTVLAESIGRLKPRGRRVRHLRRVALLQRPALSLRRWSQALQHPRQDQAQRPRLARGPRMVPRFRPRAHPPQLAERRRKVRRARPPLPRRLDFWLTSRFFARLAALSTVFHGYGSMPRLTVCLSP